jgi:hypothetical protein
VKLGEFPLIRRGAEHQDIALHGPL